MVKVIEVMAQSKKSWEHAAQKAVTKVSQSVRNIKSIYIQDKSAKIQNNKIVKYRITAKITFVVD